MEYMYSTKEHFTAQRQHRGRNSKQKLGRDLRHSILFPAQYILVKINKICLNQ